MTRAVDIALVERRYRMPDADRKVRHRLDELTETLLRDRLPGILERQGVRPDDAVCLRALRLALAYRPGMSAADCLDLWTARLAESVKEAMARGSDRALVRYRSRVHAFLDAAAALAEGRLERGWAWRRLGVTGSDHRASRASLARQWRDRLAEAPELAPAAAALARTGGALRLLERDVLEPSDMELLGRAVLAAHGVSDGAAAAGRPAPPDKDPGAPDPARIVAARDAARTDAVGGRGRNGGLGDPGSGARPPPRAARRSRPAAGDPRGGDREWPADGAAEGVRGGRADAARTRRASQSTLPAAVAGWRPARKRLAAPGRPARPRRAGPRR